MLTEKPADSEGVRLGGIVSHLRGNHIVLTYEDRSDRLGDLRRVAHSSGAPFIAERDGWDTALPKAGGKAKPNRLTCLPFSATTLTG